MATLATMITGLRELVRSIESSASNIAASSGELSMVTSQIATASEQQTSVAEEINQNITSIRDVTDHSAASSK